MPQNCFGCSICGVCVCVLFRSFPLFSLSNLHTLGIRVEKTNFLHFLNNVHRTNKQTTKKSSMKSMKSITETQRINNKYIAKSETERELIRQIIELNSCLVQYTTSDRTECAYCIRKFDTVKKRNKILALNDRHGMHANVLQVYISLTLSMKTC